MCPCCCFIATAVKPGDSYCFLPGELALLFPFKAWVIKCFYRGEK